MAISSAVLLASKNKKLYIENQHQKRKRATRRKYITKGGVLSGAEGLSHTQATQEATVEVAAERPQQAVCKCSICQSTEHTAYTCPRHQISSQ